MLPDFDYCRPATLADALALLAERGEAWAPLAGGTNIIPDMRAGRHAVRGVLDVSRLGELRGIREEDGAIAIASGTTITEVLNSRLLADVAPALYQAAASFASPLVRNRATVGGNLADASPAADMAPPLLALDAEVELAGAAGTRCMALDDFLVGVRQTRRRPDELLAAVRFRRPDGGTASAFQKVGLRKSDAISVLSVAVSLSFAGDGRCTVARIALGAVAPRPLRAARAEILLVDRRLTPDLIREAAYEAGEAARPIGDIRGSAAYRRRVTETITRRLLIQAAEGARTGSYGGTP